MAKREFGEKANLSIYMSGYISTPTSAHEIWPKEQDPGYSDICFLYRVAGQFLRGGVWDEQRLGVFAEIASFTTVLDKAEEDEYISAWKMVFL